MTSVFAPSPVEAPARSKPAITVHRVSKIYGQGVEAVSALDEVSFDVQPGELVCLVGASGCGKSTLLNLMAGLDRPTSGSITMPVGRVALMFQDPALFPWLTVEQNIEFPLQVRRVDLLHHELEQLWGTSGLTIVFVTHNVREAVRLGDRVIVLSSRPGRLAAEFHVDLPRPRHIDSAANAELAATITERLHQTMSNGETA